MTTTKPETPVAAYDTAQARLGQLQIEASNLERRAHELQGLIRAEDPKGRVQDAAESYLDGQALDEASSFRDELGDTRQRLAVVRKAVELQRPRVDAAKRERDEAILDAHQAGIETAAQRLAEALLVVGDAAEELHAATGALDAEGVSRGHRFPPLRLDPLRASVEPSRSNSLLDELEAYGAKVPRTTRDRAREARHKAHTANEDRKRKAGGAISAGPNGVVEYAPGGKARPRPEGGRKAGSDDFRTAAAWGLS